jgi:two-component sensor histidine kinase
MDALHPEDWEPTLEAWREAQENGRYYVEHRVRCRSDGAYRWFQTRAKPLREPHDDKSDWVGTSTDIHEMRTLQERQQVLLAELQHRTRNLLAVVSSVAQQTMSSSTSLDDFDTRFANRLRALGRVQGLLSRPTGARIDFRDILDAELAAHGTEVGHRVVAEGPPVDLPGHAVQTLALGIHELATNALKYGALQTPNGQLAVRWDVRENGSGSRLFELEWEETRVEGVAVDPPRRGYGRRLIERGLAYDLGAKTKLEFRAGGVRCHIAVPLERRVS